MLAKHGKDYLAYDYPVKRSLRDLKSKISKFKPDILGIHMMSHGYFRQFEIAERLKRLSRA